MWRSVTRMVAVGTTCCVAGLMGSSATASAEGSAAGEGAGASSSLGSALVTPGSPAAGEETQAQEEAKRSNPDAVAEREASRTKFEGLDTEQAAKVAGEAFPGVIEEPAGGPPKLPAGESIKSYPTDNAAQIELGGGRHGVVESMAPIAVETSSGQRAPVDLSLSEVGGAFEPRTPVVGVRIPRRLGEGASLGDTGVSLTPVDAQGTPLGGSEGTLDGTSVLYANTQTDTDSVVKPTTGGFEADTLLRSVDSPSELSFRVGLPEGASLVRGKDESGVVEVLREGVTIAVVLAPHAQDAAGTVVPVSMSVSGDTLSLSVDEHTEEYEYPVEVDPSFEDVYDTNLTGYGIPTNWLFCTTVSSECKHEEGHFRSRGWGENGYLTDEWTGSEPYTAGAAATFIYRTQGESHILETAYNTEESNNEGDAVESVIQIENERKEQESMKLLSVSKNASEAGNLNCCAPGKAEDHNFVEYVQTATGSGNHFTDTLKSASVFIEQEVDPTIALDTKDEYLIGGKWLNVLDGANRWMGPNSGAVGFTAEEKGMGVAKLWAFHELYEEPYFYEQNLLKEGKCKGVQCPQDVTTAFTYNKAKPLPSGRDLVYLYAGSAAGNLGEVSTTINVDNEAPYNLGLYGLPASGIITESQLHLTAKASDGKASTPSSGIKELSVGLDGYRIPGKSGSCTPGPCTANGEWTLSGEDLGAGKHTLELVAVDNADNYEVKKYTITVRHAGSLSVGPGSVNPTTGSLHLSSSDVSLGGGRGTLGFSRSYNSRQLTAGEQGPLGPQWSASISGSQTIEQEPSGGSVVLVNAGSGRTLFESNGKGGYISPTGDENLVLEAEKYGETIRAYLLKDPAAGTTVRYTQPGSSGPWVIADSEGALSKTSGEKEVVEWERVENVTRPKLALAPTPAGVTCTPTVKEPKELADGCRALSFAYATETTATGEAPSQWKAYKGRLMTVSFTAYNPSTKAMETKPVTEYAYDAQGRLRAEWDPRLASPLKTTYGYDSEGHVVAVNPPGQEPWLLHYGTTAGDPGAGRLLSATRPPAGTSIQVEEQDEESAPANTGSPTLSSTSPVIGTTLSISSNGSWSNGPLAYSDAWDDCYTAESKETCTAIPGADNNSYTPQARDAGYTLKAEVTAVNSAGAAVATTAASTILAAVAPAYHAQFGKVGEAGAQFKAPTGAAIDSSGDVWVADSSNSRVQELSASGTFIRAIGWGVSNGKAEFETCTSSCKAGISGSGAGQFSKPEAIAINQTTKSVYVLDGGNNRVEEFNSEGKYTGTFGKYGKEPGQLNAPKGIAIVPSGAVTSSASGEVWVGDTGNNRVDEFSETGEAIGSFGAEGSGNGQFKGPDGIAFSGEDAYVVDSGNDRVQELSLSGQYVAEFGTKGTGNGQFETPGGIATEPVSGDLYVADTANNRVEELNSAGAFLLAYGKKGEGNGEFSSPASMAINSAGDVYVADTGNNRVQELEPRYSTNNLLPEPPVLGTSSVTTVDYNVPVSGAGAPNAMTKAELEKWGQTDDPAEATAIFPPDEPMGWPAKDYKRATISYYDELGHTVNVATPSGGIATSEYNEDNEVIRSLSADNRVAALKESNPKEASELLDTKSKYNGETKEEKEQEEKEGRIEPGTRLLETRGPQHTVKLATGTEVKARNHVKYYYDEGAPADEKFSLVTKTTDGAEYEGHETGVRTTTTSYSGQGDLGWLLRKPTSVTTDPGGLTLIHRTFYEPTTGNVIETRQPASERAPSYFSQFGSEGTDSGQFKSPKGVAVAPDGDVYVADSGNNRVQEFLPTGEYVTTWGSEGTGNGQFKNPTDVAVAASGNVYVVDTGNNRVQEFSASGAYITKWGSTGSGNGLFNNPVGVAVAPNGDVYVADTGNFRVQRFSAGGTYLRQWGSKGIGNGQFESLRSIAIAANENVYTVDSNRVQEFSATGEYLAKFGSFGVNRGQFFSPTAIAVAAGGDVYVTEESRVQEFSSEGEFLTTWGSSGAGNGQFHTPDGITVTAGGAVYVSDTFNNRIQAFTLGGPMAFRSNFGSEGAGNGQFKSPDDVAVAPDGDVYVADAGNNRVQEFSPTGTYIAKWGSGGVGNGQFKSPAGVAVASDGNVYVVDSGNDRVQEFSSTGTYITQWGSEGSGSGQFRNPVALAVAPNGNVYVVDSNHVQEFSASGEYLSKLSLFAMVPTAIAVASNGTVYLVESDSIREFSSTGEYITKWSSAGGENGELNNPTGIAVAPNGYVYVADTHNNRVSEFTATGEFVAKFGVEGVANGQFKDPKGIAVGPGGGIYVADVGNDRVQELVSASKDAHDTQTIYYSVGTNVEHPSCGGHPEWANLVCQNRPAEQAAGALPELPVVTDTYNIWDEPEAVTEEFGTKMRNRKLTYDSAGRLSTTEETSSVDTSLPEVADEYSSETGAMVKQSTTVGETTKSIKSVHNTLGQLTEYTDADGNTTQYVYSGPVNDGQVEEVNYGGSKGSQMYSYDPTSKALTKLLDVGPEGSKGAGTFTASYDVEGKMTSGNYPNGMTAKYTFNPASEATGIEYEKTTHCAGTCPEAWFKEVVVPSIHGEALVRTSTLAKEEYTYDNAGRLTQVNETPTGKGCSTRVYAYDEDSNRVSLTTRKSETETCATSGGTTEKHTYDEADRLNDVGVSYEAFGNQTKVPAADAGEHEITASFYVDNQVATQKQNGETTNYTYDPAARTEKTVSEGATNATVINHYPGPGESISWTEEEAGKQWTRNIPGIDGTLTATQHDGEAAVLQLHDLEGDIVATAGVSETETKLLTTYNPTEFGVQVNGPPPAKFSWLGAGGLATEQSSGAANPRGSSYVPQLGAPLQTEAVVPPGAAPDGTYIASYVNTLPSEAYAAFSAFAAGAPGREAERQKAAQEQWEREHPPTPPGATPAPGEGGPEDPTNNVILFTPSEAIGYGEALCNCAVVHGIGSAIEAIGHKIGIPGVGEVVEEVLNGGLAESFGKELLYCGEYIESNSANRCALEYHSWSVGGFNTWLPTTSPVSIGACYYYKKSSQGEKRGLHCKDGQFYKQGSY